MEPRFWLNRKGLPRITTVFFIILFSMAGASHGAGIDANVNNVNTLLNSAATAVQTGKYDESKSLLEATANNLENANSWAYFIWTERQSDPDYVPASLDDLPQELTVKYYDDLMVATQDQYTDMLQKIQEAQIQLGIKKFQTLFGICESAVNLSKGITDTLTGNPLMAPKTLYDLHKQVQVDVAYIKEHFTALESAKQLPKHLIHLKDNLVKLFRELRRVREKILVLTPQLKRIEIAFPMALNSIQQGLDMPLPSGPKPVFDSTPYTAELTQVEGGLTQAELSWESGLMILDEIHVQAKDAYNAIVSPTSEDDRTWKDFESLFTTRKTAIISPRGDDIQVLTALGDEWRQALIGILNQFMEISFGSPVPLKDCSAHKTIDPSLDLDWYDSRVWKTEYATVLGAPVGPDILPAQAGSAENDWHEVAINYPSRLLDLLNTYSRAWQSAYASMTYADWEALSHTVDTRQPYQVFVLERQSLNLLLENLNAIRSEAVRFAGAVSATDTTGWDLAGLQSKADAFRQFMADHAATVPEAEFGKYAKVTETDVAGISQRLLLAVDGISVLETEAVIGYLEREMTQFDFEAGEMAEEATKIGNTADAIAFDINRMLTFNDALASKQPAAKEMLDYKFDYDKDVFLGKGDHGYLFDSLEILDNALWQHVDTWYYHNSPPDIQTQILPHLELIESCGSIALNRFAWLTEQIWSVTDNLTFATPDIKPNPSTRGTAYDAGASYIVLSENKAVVDQFTSVRFLRYHMRPYTDPMGYVNLDQIRQGLPRTRAWLDAQTTTGYTNLTLLRTSDATYSLPVNQTITPPVTLQITDASGNPVPGVPVTLNYDAQALHGEGMHSTDAYGKVSFHPGPYPHPGHRTLTFSVAGDFALDVQIQVVADTDGDGCGDDWETAYGFNPAEALDGLGDFDDDGLTNAQEQVLGTHPLKPDTDDDGFTDEQEMTAGSDPIDPENVPVFSPPSIPVPAAMRLGTDWEKTSDYIGVDILTTYPSKFTKVIPFKDRIWAFGYKEVWSSENGIQWTKHPDIPEWAPRYAYAMTVHNNRLWVTGGTLTTGSDTATYSDVWVSDDGLHWNKVNGAANFGARGNAHLLSMGGNLWLIGGYVYGGSGEQNDVWTSKDGVDWAQITAAAPWPLRRSFGFSSTVFDNKLWIMGGDWQTYDDQTGQTIWKTFQDIWNSSDGINWTRVTDTPAWPARYDTSLTVLNGKLWLFGGTTHTQNVYMSLNEAWVSEDGIDWKALKGPSAHKAEAFSFANDLWLYNDRVKNFSGYTNNRFWRSRGPVLDDVITETKPMVAHPKVFSTGASHVLAIAADGTLWAWGSNHAGQLGDTTTLSRSKPVQIGIDSDWQAVTAGMFFSMALKTDGSLWAWGQNYNGQVGNGTTDNQLSPVRIGMDTDWATMAAGQSHALAIKTDGSLWAWGSNNGGQLGDGTKDNKTTPVRIGTGTSWVEISAGSTHSIGIQQDGSVWIWGNNYYWQLGTGTAEEFLIPSQGNEVEWSALNIGQTVVSAGSSFTAALGSDGLLRMWGSNRDGQIGSGETASYIPMLSITPFDSWRTVACGSGQTAAIKTDNTLWAWGSISYFQPADITYTPDNLPVPIGSDTDWCAVSSGSNFSVAQKADGSLWAWGNNGDGQLGNGTNEPNNTPSLVLSLGPTKADADGDWMDDVWEIDHFTDTSRDGTGDYDSDGLTDFFEFRIGTLPDNGDSDQDGMPDKWELDLDLNPLADDAGKDADTDGLSNLEEYQMVMHRYTPEGGIAAMAAIEDFLYVIDGQTNTLNIIDVTHPSRPVSAATYTAGFQNVRNMRIKGTRACVAYGEGSFHLIDMEDPTGPQSLGTYESGENYIQGFDFSDTHLVYAGSDGSLQVVDISNPESPVHKGSYDNDGNRGLGEIILTGNRAYVTESSNGVQIIDISTPTAPYLAGEYKADLIWPPSLGLSGDLLYAATRSSEQDDRQNALTVINTIDPAQILELGAYPGFLEGLALSGELAGALIDGSVDLIDVSNPMLPRRLADIDNISDIRISEIVIVNDLLYARYGFGIDSGVAIVDISKFSRLFITAEPGDIDHSESIDMVDALLSLKVLTCTPRQNEVFFDGDVDNDQQIGIEEAVNAIQKAVGF